MKKKQEPTMFDEFEKAQMGDDYEHETTDSVHDKITPSTKIKIAKKMAKAQGAKAGTKENEMVKGEALEGTDVPPVERGRPAPKKFEAESLERALDQAIAARVDGRLEHRNKLVESLYQQLFKLAEGECVSYAELSEKAGIDVRFSGRRMLMDARRQLEESPKGRVFSATRFLTKSDDGFYLVQHRGLTRVEANEEMLEKGRFWIRDGLRKLKKALRYLELTDKYRLNDEDRERLIRSSMAVESALTFLDESVTGSSRGSTK